MKTNFKHRYFVLLFLTLAFSCSSAQKAKKSSDGKPVWVDDPHRKYPEAVYLTGVGSGDTRKAAENNAYGNIVKIFRAEVTVDQQLVERYLESGKDGKIETSSFVSDMLRDTRVQGNQQLKNVVLDQYYFDEKGGVYYALAYMDRAETAALYQQEIESNNARIADLYQRFKSADNKLKKYAFLATARDLSDINAVLNQQYTIISRMDEPIAPPVGRDRMSADLRDLVNSISVHLADTGDSPAAIKDYLKAAVGQIGFPVKETGGDFQISYSLEMAPTDIGRENLVALNWKLTLQLKDALNNAVVHTFNENKRTAAISEAEARSRILRTAKELIDKEFLTKFQTYLRTI